MAWFKTGGGIDVNLSDAPDANYTNANMANNATATLAVTQKPKFIVMCLTTTSTSNNNYGTIIIDVDNDSAYILGYWSSNFHIQSYSVQWHDYITSVSDSSIGIKNSWGSSVRVIVGAYY